MKIFRSALPFAALVGACTSPIPTPADDAADASVLIESGTADRPDVPNNDVPNNDVPNNDVPNVPDVPSIIADTGVCPMGTMACGVMGCIDVQTNPAHCGMCGVVCPAVPNGAPRCAAGVCGATCNAGFEPVGSACLPAGAAPRPTLPLSLGDVSLRRPTLRWELPAGANGALVELCRDRACTMIIESLRVMGTSARPMVALPANSVVFWRLRATVGAGTSMTFSPTWFFHVPARDNSGAIDTSAYPHLDLNGDGFDDVVVGAPNADPSGRANAGTASIFHGSAMGTRMAPTRVLEGVAMGDAFGFSVASAGDVNGDGFGDLVVGAYLADPGGRTNAGTASVYYGSAMGIAMAPNRVLEGVAIDDNLGNAVASAGDVNGDGFGDLIVGAQQADPGGRSNAGSASVFHGGGMGISMAAARILEGELAGDRFGWSIAAVGDANGDGFGDVVVGAYLAARGGRLDTGTASVFHGSAMGVPMAPARVIEGLATGDRFSYSLAGAGDLNGDGYNDLVVGAYTADPRGVSNAGTASVFHGSMSGIPMVRTLVLEGVAANDLFGWSVARAGDVNSDGFSDLLVGAYNAAPGGRMAAGIANIFHGSAMGVVVAPARIFEGANAFDNFGIVVASAGDVNGDGFGDVIIAAYQADPGGRSNAGAASVFHGSAMGLPVAAAVVLEGVAAGDNFGATVAKLSDQYRHRRGHRVINGLVERAIRRFERQG